MRTKIGVGLLLGIAFLGVWGTAAACQHAESSEPGETRSLDVYKPILRIDNGTGLDAHSTLVSMRGTSAAPESGCLPEVADRIASDSRLRTLHRLVERAGMSDALAGPAALTLLAPTEEAFAQMPAERLRELEADRSALVDFLRRHVVVGLLDTPLLEAHSAVLTAAYEPLVVRAEQGLTVGGAKVIGSSLGARNAVIHLIDRPLAFGPSI